MFCRFREGRRGVDGVVAKYSVMAQMSRRQEAYIAFNESVNRRKDILVTGDIFNGIWTVLFHPTGVSRISLSSTRLRILTKASYLELPPANQLRSSLPFHWRLTS